MKKFFALATTAFALVAFTGPATLAQQVISFPVEGITVGEPGETIVVATETVPTEHIGWVCSGRASTVNNGSIHPGNDLHIVSGNSEITIENVEDIPSMGHEIEQVMVLGDTITVSITLGSDGISSGGFVISFSECAEQVSISVPPTIVDVPTTVAVPTTAPEPSGPTVVESTTSIVVSPVTTAPAPAGPTATLPVTGTSTTYMIASSGLALLGAGIALLALVQLTASRVKVSRVRSK